jgi:TusA-related sulfurtransferase
VPSPAEPSVRLDLRGTPCPLNYIRATLALETLDPGAWLQLDLDRGEPEEMVIGGLRQAGHPVLSGPHPDAADAAVRVLVCRDGG